MFEDTYRSMNEQIIPDQQLIGQTISVAKKQIAQRKFVVRMRAARKTVLVVALVLCLCFAVPALAVNVPTIYALMYEGAPTVAQFFIPVQKSCEDQGISMEVVSTYMHGDTAEIYVTMQDLTGKRIDDTTDLFDSYEMNFPFDSSGGCSRVAFDPETKTATFLIKISTLNGENIPGGKGTFSVRCFISGKQERLEVPLSVDWAKVDVNPEIQQIETYSDNIIGNSITEAEMSIPIYDTVLVPGKILCSVSDGFQVSAMGYIEGKLHIQMDIPGRLEFDDHARLYLTGSDGKRLEGNSVYLCNYDFETGEQADYIDYVFDVTPEQLPNFTLCGDFYTATTRTDGNWRVTFPLVVTENVVTVG
ncbi:MAG: DUF4179 domain-containing protein [Clostridia bacterium]